MRTDDDTDLEADDGDEEPTHSYVPIDPCQPVIAALRAAMSEHIPRAFIDLETARFVPNTAVLPDAYALKKVSVEQFAAAVLPAIERPQERQVRERIAHMARRLRQLEQKYKSILFVCSMLDWPWIREAYVERAGGRRRRTTWSKRPTLYQPDERTLMFLLGELPFITGLYERARAELEDDENLSIDGVKELLITARKFYQDDLKRRARKITPHLLRQCLKYIRNLTLFEKRFTPDLYTIITAAKQTAGDQYALHVAETAREYPYAEDLRPAARFSWASIAAGCRMARSCAWSAGCRGRRWSGGACSCSGGPIARSATSGGCGGIRISQCSWPPEDKLIEDFRAHVFDRARAVMGADLARTEPFTTSMLDGIDIRDTLRHWYEEKIYVKVLPPSRGKLDCVVMLFDSPADPRDYPWRTTWYAEHDEESTLAFFATDFSKELVGPGIALATYGGALFLFPPVAIPDIWRDPGARLHRDARRATAGGGLPLQRLPAHRPAVRRPARRRLAEAGAAVSARSGSTCRCSQFSDATIQQLRMVHVLNGREVRSYAADFIRKA